MDGTAAEDGASPAHIKATREDWLRLALDVLVSDGIGEVKVLALARRLDVSRSSFYWYFGSRQDLLDALLDRWNATNTRAVLAHAEAPMPTITAAVAHVFRCFVDPDLFSPRLDFAVREWSRRSGAVRRVLDRADDRRLAALTAMFARHGYTDGEAETRARVLYFMQIGYYALELGEPLEDRLDRVGDYLLAFTGRHASEAEIAEVRRFARAVAAR
ncbi:MAG: TetR/AcrR family transcriptional regulator [Pseudomonadota bacterium]